jgi:hypothetical protein
MELIALGATAAGEQLWPVVIGPLLTALFGGLAVNWVVQKAQDRRATRKLRDELSAEIMNVAYRFYFILIEVIRTEDYKASTSPQSVVGIPPPNPSDLASRYEEFRITARVLEEKLRVSFRTTDARWLWHGVVDALSSRYYRLVHVRERYEGMINTHGQHPTDNEIPLRVRLQLMTLSEYRDEESVDNAVLKKFEDLLNQVIDEIHEAKVRPPRKSARARAAAVLQPGRGSYLPPKQNQPRLTGGADSQAHHPPESQDSWETPSHSA